MSVVFNKELNDFVPTAVIVDGVCTTAPVYERLGRENEPEVGVLLGKMASAVGRIAVCFKLAHIHSPEAGHCLWSTKKDLSLYNATAAYFVSSGSCASCRN
jgi:hypothetical protein